MWIGERITEYGISNGISLIIFIGIISTAGLTIVAKFGQAVGLGVDKANPAVLWELLGFAILTILEFTAIVAVDLSERRIPVQYAKQVKGRRMYGGQSSNIPMKISGAGVMPLIFAFALISFPQMIISLFWPDSGAAQGITDWFSGSSQYWYGQLIYTVTLCVLIFAFAFFYQSMQFNPGYSSRQTHCGLFKENFQQNNAFRSHLSVAGCAYTVCIIAYSGQPPRRHGYGASVGILDDRYSNRSFGCARTRQTARIAAYDEELQRLLKIITIRQ